MLSDDARDLLAVQRTLQGDPQAFAEIVKRYTPLLFSLSYRLLGSPEEAEDAVQEIFVKVYRSLARFAIQSRFYSWIYTIGLNWLRSRLRKRRPNSRHNVLPLAVSESNPADVLVRKENEQRIHEAIRKLPLIYREPFVLRHLEDLSMNDIADILVLPVGTVRVRLHRAKEKMLGLLADLRDTK